MKTWNTIPTRLFGQIKYHKQGHPIRLIVSTIDSAAYKMARFLATILRKAFKPKYGIKNSKHFIKLIRGKRITKGNILVSYDVVNCFGTIPTELALELIERDFDRVEQVTPIPKEDFLKMLKICLEQANYFVFAGKFYRQKLGMFMGSSLAPILVERVIEDIVDKALRDMNLNPDFWCTYVDDHLTAIPKETAEILKEKLNSYNPNVQFTMEVQKSDKSIEFLDTTVFNEGESLKTKWFHKPIASNRLLNYYSQHPRSMVINTAKSFIRRVFTLSHASFHKENKETIKRIMDKNNFPERMTEQLIHQVVQMMFNQKSRCSSAYPLISISEINESTISPSISTLDSPPPPIANSTMIDTTITPAGQPTSKKKMFAGMTYVPNLTEVVAKQIRKYVPEMQIAPRPPEKVSHLFSNMKQKLNIGQCSCVVYNIPCKNCPRCYVGETTWRLDDRTGQHKNDLKNIQVNNKKTALVHHVFKKGHEFDFNSKEILKKVRAKRTIKIHEANQIILKGNLAVNFRKDAAHVSPMFYNLIKNSKRHRNVNPRKNQRNEMNLQQMFG